MVSGVKTIGGFSNGRLKSFLCRSTVKGAMEITDGKCRDANGMQMYYRDANVEAIDGG